MTTETLPLPLFDILGDGKILLCRVKANNESEAIEQTVNKSRRTCRAKRVFAGWDKIIARRTVDPTRDDFLVNEHGMRVLHETPLSELVFNRGDKD